MILVISDFICWKANWASGVQEHLFFLGRKGLSMFALAENCARHFCNCWAAPRKDLSCLGVRGGDQGGLAFCVFADFYRLG